MSLRTAHRALPLRDRDGIWTGLLALVAGAVAVGGVVLADYLGGSRVGVLAALILVIGAGAPTALRLRREGLDAPGLTALATIVLIGLTSVAWLGTPEGPGPGIDRLDITIALVLVALALACLGLGARLVGPARPIAPFALRPDDAPTWPVLIAASCASVAAVSVAVVLESYGYIADPEAAQDLLVFGQVFGLLGTLGNLVVLASALVYFARGGRRFRLLLIALVAVQVAIGFASGGKTPTIMPLVLVLLAYAVTRRRVPVTALALTLVLLFVAVVPMNARYREAVRVEGRAPTEALATALAQPIEANPAAALGDTRDYVLRRFRSIDSIALIHDQTPSRFEYAGGGTYYLLPAIMLVPRAVWPDKPVLDAAGQFTQTYRGASEEIRSSTQLTQVGDLYRNLGWPGVAGGMFLWGALLAGGTALYRRNPSPRATFVYILVIPTVLLRVEADLPVLLASAARDLPFAALVGWLLLPGRASGPGYRRLLGRSGVAPPPSAARPRPS